MSSLLQNGNNYCDFFNHVDAECKKIITPYINSIERTLLKKHNDSTHYHIPFVIQSLLSAYYCDHLHHRLAFKHKFSKWPTKCHFILDYNRGLCRQRNDWKCCSSIERILCILNNFQYYVQSQSYSKHAIAPYVTYKYYQIDQILADIQHINAEHPQNTVKFYIRNRIMRNMEKSENECCYEPNFWNDDESNDLEANMKIFHQQFVHHSLAKYQFENAAKYILTHNQDPIPVLTVLKSCSRKLLLPAAKYRTLDTTNPRVQERLMGFDGVLHFLSLIGFESNALGTALRCRHDPSIHVIKSAIAVIDSFIAETQPIVNNGNGQNDSARNGISRWFGKMKEKGKRIKLRMK